MYESSECATYGPSNVSVCYLSHSNIYFGLSRIFMMTNDIKYFFMSLLLIYILLVVTSIINILPCIKVFVFFIDLRVIFIINI